MTKWSHMVVIVSSTERTHEDLVFKALADPTRRSLLDRLFARTAAR